MGDGEHRVAGTESLAFQGDGNGKVEEVAISLEDISRSTDGAIKTVKSKRSVNIYMPISIRIRES